MYLSAAPSSSNGRIIDRGLHYKFEFRMDYNSSKVQSIHQTSWILEFPIGKPFFDSPHACTGRAIKIAAINEIFYLNSRTIYSGVFKGRLLRTSIGYSRVRNVHFEEHVDHSGLDCGLGLEIETNSTIYSTQYMRQSLLLYFTLFSFSTHYTQRPAAALCSR